MSILPRLPLGFRRLCSLRLYCNLFPYIDNGKVCRLRMRFVELADFVGKLFRSAAKTLFMRRPRQTIRSAIHKTIALLFICSDPPLTIERLACWRSADWGLSRLTPTVYSQRHED